MLKCYIEGRNLINGVEARYTISEGAVFTENYNETLDSGTIILPQLTSEIEIEPYDVVVIFTTDDSQIAINERRLCVDTYVCTQTSLDPAIYKYEISLFSETKILEGILLPSISITRNESNPRTIEDYLRFYLYQYGPYNNFSAVNGPYDLAFTLNVGDRFNVECPEMQWNEPNLREVLNDLMMVQNCIVTLKNNVIGYMDISSYGSEITLAQRRHINYIQKSQSSSDYTSELKTRIVNSVGADEVTNICENITWRNNEVYIIDTENMKVETNYPIWNLKRFVVNFHALVDIRYTLQVEQQSYVYDIDDFPIDMSIVLYDSNTKLVLEYGEWQTKNILYALPYTHSYSTDYQNTCLYYTRGQKGIHNFNSKLEGKALWIPYSRNVYEMILNLMFTGSYYTYFINKVIEQYPQVQFATDITPTIEEVNWRTVNFNLEYETLGEYTFLASKTNFTRHKRQVVDNQTNSYVNAKTFGFLEYMKANRLGNRIKLINGRWDTSESLMPALARKVNGSIIFRKEIAVYENYIKANFQATDNYVLRDYFTGVKSKLRSWRVISGNEAFLRADNLKFYINNNISSLNGSYIIPVYSTLQEYLNKFNYCCVKINTSGYNYLPNSSIVTYKGNSYNVDLYMLEFQKNIVGNSVLFSFKMLDNAIVGKYVNDDEYNVGNNTLLMTQKNASYVDENGENEGGVIYFYQNYSLDSKTDAVKQALHNLYPAVASSGQYSGLSNLVAQIPFTFRKDNKEITSITIQFEWNENANNIYFGKK